MSDDQKYLLSIVDDVYMYRHLVGSKWTYRVIGYHGNGPSVTIPSNADFIDFRAFFYNMDITSLTLPASLQEIGQGAFQYCEKLSTVTYLGRVAEWEQSVIKPSKWPQNTKVKQIVCSDGVINL